MSKEKGVDFTKVTAKSYTNSSHISRLPESRRKQNCQRQVADSTDGFLLAYNGLTSPEGLRLGMFSVGVAIWFS